MDIVDAADSVVELWTADAERRARGKSAPESHPEFDGSHCVECGDLIHPDRLKLGRIRCIYCQGEIERLARTRA
jgi:RNA polymerase-binding transcription factor DksA